MIRRWLKRWLTKDEISLDVPHMPRRNCLEFVVHQAAGGMVVESSRWDDKLSQRQTELHIITTEQDFGQEINRILFMHNLKH